MRLIDTKTHELKEFLNKIPKYAILSHTWGEEEVTYKEYLYTTNPDDKRGPEIKQKSGFSKILRACERAQADELQYLWCDTNCIDKRSSAELSEAINSMYAWYRDSAVCYAFLNDVDGTPGSFEKSRWFTRGWTLQELIAPSKVIFLNSDWEEFGDRNGLADIISSITRIHIGVLWCPKTVSKYSIAQRMSWAADRETARQEDIAYCLLGIFDINMPLLYGEGSRAFIRLQYEIIKCSDDQSILAWNIPHTGSGQLTGALALTPWDFRFCGSIIYDPDILRFPFAITNIGLTLKRPRLETSLEGLSPVGLNCVYELRGCLMTDDPNDSIIETYRRFRVVIWLWHSGSSIVERAHMPEFPPLFDASYLVSTKEKVVEYVIHPRTLPTRRNESSGVTDKSNYDPFVTGFLVCVGVGRINTRTMLYNKNFPIGKITTEHLRKKTNSSLSHHCVSDGVFSVLMSAAWDKKGAAIDRVYTCYHDRDGQVFRHLSQAKELSFIYKDAQLPIDISDELLYHALHRIHYHVERLIKEIETASDLAVPPSEFRDGNGSETITVVVSERRGSVEHSIPVPPSVFFEEDTLRDGHGSETIAATVVFGERRGSVEYSILSSQLGDIG